MNWWKKAVVYQIYLKSFFDSNNDGIGDLNGVIKKLPYLKKLGIQAIWISPFFKSPMLDNGYDVANYKKINKIFGTMKDFDNLVKKAEKNNIKIIIDLIVNHTSTDHQWFKKALLKEKKYENYYYFTNKPVWEKKSVFGGEAWQKINDQYYLHTFAINQADLNWNNQDVRNEFINIINFWIKKGIGGIRFDVIDEIAKNLDREKLKNNENIDINKLHKFIKQWKQNSLWNKKDLLTVGESWHSFTDQAILYTNPSRNELAMIFGFEHITVNWKNQKWYKQKLDLVKFKKVINKWQIQLENQGWQALFLSNHDLPRMISNFGDDKKFRLQSGKCLALTMHLLKGTPFIYQGEEIGMINTKFDSLEQHKDIEIFQLYNNLKSKNKKYTKQMHLKFVKAMNRDNARTPMQWSDNLNAGFSKNKPWIKINDNYKEINVKAALNNKDSLFYWYQKLIKMRTTNKNLSKILIEGKFNILDLENKAIFSFERIYQDKKIILIANWSSRTIKYKINYNKKDIFLNNYNDFYKDKLLPWQAICFIKKQIYY